MSLFCCFVLWSSPARLEETIHQKRRFRVKMGERRMEDGKGMEKDESGGGWKEEQWGNGRRVVGGKGAENLRGESERGKEGKEKDGKEKVEEGKDIHNDIMYICMLWGDTWFP